MMPARHHARDPVPDAEAGDSSKSCIRSFAASKWVVDAVSAHALIASGALLIHARRSGLKASRPVQNPVSVSWQHFSDKDAPLKGRLLSDDMVLTQRFRALGVKKDIPVLVVDDSKLGGGEAGRLTWTFRTLGHPSTHLLDDGTDALAESRILPINPPPIFGDFTVTRDLRFQVTMDELRNSIGRSGIAILDVREPREYAVETPYGESRG